MNSYHKIILGVFIPLFLTGCISHSPEPNAPAPIPVKPDLAQPAVFNTNTAMLAILASYNSKEKGTLLPTKFTRTWNLKKAETLVRPLLAKSYKEAEKTKAVLVVQRQPVSEGVVEDCHDCAPEISVYVFNYTGGKWIFEKGKQSVAKAGANGDAPAASLIKIGDNKLGILFEGGDMHQGYTNEYAFIVPISDKIIMFDAPFFNMGQSNTGACAQDIKKQADFKQEPCWQYSGQISFVDIHEPYYGVVIQYSGDVDHLQNNLPLTNSVHYVKAAMGNYQSVDFAETKSVYSF